MAIEHDPRSFSTSDDEEEDDLEEEVEGTGMEFPISSPLIGEAKTAARRRRQGSLLESLMAAFRRSLFACSVEPEREGKEEEEEGETDVCSSEMEIGWPTDVRHIAHVTFDRFRGFLGLPEELEPEVPRKVPSASASVFGVSATSMQCMYDERGNSIPIILLMMQGHLYSQGGLQTEGIFRINGENGHESYIREQLNMGIVPQEVDLHCLAGLIKAWFRELPSGVLDSLTPDQVMHCNTEEECSMLVSLLPSREAALLDWVVNLMADVVQNEKHNKMNARSISMVFAPNMTQMADPLTALIYAVQVMNFLRTLILKTLRERNESIVKVLPQEFSPESLMSEVNAHLEDVRQYEDERIYDHSGSFTFDQPGLVNFMLQRQQVSQLNSDVGEESFNSSGKASDADEVSSHQIANWGHCSPASANKYSNVDHKPHDRPGQKRGVKKLCWHPIFRLSNPVKKSDRVKTNKEKRESWAKYGFWNYI